jgi:2-amino-4-hydroxy-6-hydroxymethyldihydropteridine diphosphokinase
LKRKSDLDHLVYIGIGSNIDDRTAFLTEAIRRMNADDNISITNISSIFESRPLGNKSVLPFLNGVVELTTKYLPSELFKNLQRFERGIGRKPR